MRTWCRGIGRVGFIIMIWMGGLGCSSLSVVTPNPTIESPELRGAGAVFLQLGNYSAHRYRATQDASVRPPNIDDPELLRVRGLSAGLGFEFLQQFKLMAALDPFNGTSLLKGQWQWLGEPTSTAEAGTWSSSVTAQGSYARNTNSGEQNGVLGHGGHPWKGEISAVGSALGLSLGYRFNENFMFFGGGAYGHTQVSTSIDQSPNSSGTSLGGSYSVKDNGNAYTFGLGGQMGRRLIGLLQYQVTHLQYDHVKDTENMHEIVFGILF